MSARQQRVSDDSRNYLAALAFIAGVLVVTVLAFGGLHFSSAFTLKAVVTSGNQLRSGSPVRIAGIDVGTVTKVERGPGHTSQIKMRLEKSALPLHTDATLKVRPRLFLEGGFYVDLKAGSPSAPTMKSNFTMPLGQTAVPVQLNDLLSSLDQPTRASFTGLTREFDKAVSNGGVESFKRTAPNLAPALKDLAWVSHAALGQQPHDVSKLIQSAAKISTATADNNDHLASLIGNLDVTAQALNSGDGALGRTLDALDHLLTVAPPALRGVNASLPELTRFSRELAPGLKDAPQQLKAISSAITDLSALVAPAERNRVVNALNVTFQNLPDLVNRLATLFPVTRPLTQCLGSHVVPTFLATVPDGDLSTGQPTWKEFAHALVGFSGLSQNFDANGYSVRYGAGVGVSGLATETLPGLGQVFAQGSKPLQSRPTWLGNGVAPAYRPDVDCSSQALPNLESKTRTAATRAVSSRRVAPKVTRGTFGKLLQGADKVLKGRAAR